MDEKMYERLSQPVLQYKNGVRILKLTNKLITTLVYILYPLLLILLILKKDTRAIKVLLIPGISFNLLSIFRVYFNSPRPYEILDIDPILKKETKGKSFPSRHVFSIFIISMAFYYINPIVGFILMILGSILALTRVIGGVHFPKDVIVGGLLGIIFGILGFYIV